MTRICVRADGGGPKGAYGLGHISRSIAVGLELRALGADVIFITEDYPVAINKIKAAGFMLIDQKPPDACNDAYMRRAFFQHEADILVIDLKHYSVSPEWVRALRGWDRKIVMIDPMTQGMFMANLTIFTNAHQDQSGWGAWDLPYDYWGHALPPRQVLHGGEYTVMNPKVVAMRDKEECCCGFLVRGVLVTTGGADPKGIMAKLIPMLPSDITFYLMPGEGFTTEHTKAIDAAIEKRGAHGIHVITQQQLYDDKHIRGHISRSVVAFGISAYESALMQWWPLTIAHSEENVWGSCNFSRLGASIDGNHIDDLTPSKFANLLNELLTKEDWKAIERLDGKGAERCAKAILELVK